MKLSNIIFENELERFSVSGQMKQTDRIVDLVAKAIAQEYDMKDDGMLIGTIRDAVITAKYDIDESVDEVDNKIQKVELSYTDYGRIYGVYINGRKVDRDEGIKTVSNLAGIKVPYTYDLDTVNQIINKLRDQGIEADESEMDVS